MTDDELPELELDDDVPRSTADVRTPNSGGSARRYAAVVPDASPTGAGSGRSGRAPVGQGSTAAVESSAGPLHSLADGATHADMRHEPVQAVQGAVLLGLPGASSGSAVKATERRGVRAAMVAYAAALLSCAGLCGGVAGNSAYNRLWNTPERALGQLVNAAESGDLPRMRGYVAPSAWPISEPAVPAGLDRVLHHFEGVEHITWTDKSNEAVASTWSEPTSVPEVTAGYGIWMERRDGHWKVSRFAGGWGEDVREATSLLADMRRAAVARDASGFLVRVLPTDETCEGKACKAIADAIATGADTTLLDVILMQGVVPGSLRVMEQGDDVVFRWLRETRYLEQHGMYELRFRRVDGVMVVVGVDNSNFRELDEEMETWTENHGEMLWRAQVSNYLEVKSLDAFCDEWFYGVCVTKVLPTHVQNIGNRTIREVKVSKVRALRYMGNASQTLWGVYRNIAPGKGTSNPSSASPPVTTRGGLDLGETWEFYRVNWVVFDDGARLDYDPTDYRDAKGVELAFEDVRSARVKGGMQVKRYENLRHELEAGGFAPNRAATR
jgi:hypothetical protein